MSPGSAALHPGLHSAVPLGPTRRAAGLRTPHTIAVLRLAHTSVPAVSTSKAIATIPHSETAGTAACSETSAIRNPILKISPGG